MGKKRRSRKKDDFGFGDAAKMIGGTVVLGTTALLGSQIISELGD